MKLHILTLEVGSTMTKANGFVRTEGGWLEHRAQGFAPTSVAEGDVSIGVEAALASLGRQFSIDNAEIFINSSAAGGLKMTVHGLTPTMTARAANEASLGAGAIIRKLTAGLLSDFDLDEICSIKPNLILLAGGVEFGDTATVWANAEKLLNLPLEIPIIYAGNSALRNAIAQKAASLGKELWLAENVFPEVDVLNVAPLRKLIHDAFSRHIIHAPGMNKLTRYTTAQVLPTPGAVLLATQIFADAAGDTLLIDVGGATTDVHSVTSGSVAYNRLLTDPEPREKRTVEGDLGVFVNAENVLALDLEGIWKSRSADLKAMPTSEREQELTQWLTTTAVMHAVKRHAGTIRSLYTPSGRVDVVKGKDLTAVQWIIGTGGALTRVPGGEDILAKIKLGAQVHLLPGPEAKILLDKNYLFSALGTIAYTHKDLVQRTLEKVFLTGVM